MVDFPRCAVCRVTIKVEQAVIFRSDGRVQHVACPPVTCEICAGAIMPRTPIRRDGEAMLHFNCWLKQHRAQVRGATQ